MNLILREDKIAKYRDHIEKGAKLTAKEKQVFDRYFFAFTQLLDGLSERQVVELLMICPEPIGGLSQSSAYNVVNGCQEIFGTANFDTAKKTAKRYIYATRLEELANKIEATASGLNENSSKIKWEDIRDPVERMMNKNQKEKLSSEAGILYEKAANVLMKAAKIKGLLEKDRVENPNKFRAAPNIIFTDDLGALDLIRQIEDTEYEDVRRDEGEDSEGSEVDDESEQANGSEREG